MFLTRFPLDETSEDGLNDYLNQYIAYVISYTVIGPEGFDDSHLLTTFLKFNQDAINGIGLSIMLPSFLRTFATRPIEKKYANIRSILIPTIRKMRLRSARSSACFLPFILDVTNDDSQACGK